MLREGEMREEGGREVSGWKYMRRTDPMEEMDKIKCEMREC